MTKKVLKSRLGVVKEVLKRRESFREELDGALISIKLLLEERDHTKLVNCIALSEKLVEIGDKLKGVASELKVLANANNLEVDDMEAEDVAASTEMDKTSKDLVAWIAGIKIWKAQQEEAQRQRTNIESGNDEELEEGTTSGRDDHLGCQQELADKEEIIREQAEEMAELTSRVGDLQSKAGELEDAYAKIDDLHTAMTRQQEDHDRRRTEYESVVDKLRTDVSRLSTSQEAWRPSMFAPGMRGSIQPGAGTSSPRTSMGEGRTMNQEEMMSVMQQSNLDMVKSVLDEHRDYQRRFFHTMQSPKMELKTFNGDVTQYRPFISRFDDLVGNTESSNSVKLNMLLQYCGDLYLSSVEYLPPREGYLSAKKLLKERYGKPSLIVNAWLDKMMSYSKVTSAEDIQLFANDLKSCKQSLEAMGCIGELDNTDKKRRILSKLPLYVQNRWRTKHRERNQEDQVATLDDLVKLVTDVAYEQADPIYGYDVMNKFSSDGDKKTVKKDVPVKRKASMSTTGVATEEAKADAGKGKKSPPASKPAVRESCACCGASHFTRLCEKWRTMSGKERLEMVRKKPLCLLCLSSRHVVEKCFFTWACRVTDCGGRHNNALHEALEDEAGDGVIVGASRCVTGKPIAEGRVGDDLKITQSILAKPMLVTEGMKEYAVPVSAVYVQGLNGEFETHADTGGSFSVVSRRMQQKAGILATSRAKFKMSTLSSDEYMDVDVCTFVLRGKDEGKCQLLMNAVVMDREIVDERYAKIFGEAAEKWPHIKSVQMQKHNHGKIDILIGQDNAHLMIKDDEVRSEEDAGPYAVRTPVGWTIHGYNMDGSKQSVLSSYTLTPGSMSRQTCDEKLVHAVDRMMTLDEVPDVEVMSPVNQKILTMWEKECKLEKGRVMLPIPVKGDKLQLPNNLSGVMKRHEALGRRLEKDPELKRMFVTSMKVNFEEEYIEDAPEEAPPGGEWYIPIQPVVSDNKPGRCRVVGDASYVFLGHCLNKAVHQGPNMTANVVDIILKFRRYKIVITGDIRAMYNQTRVPECQRDCMRILWWEDDDPTKKITKHRYTTHMFGGIWSPAAAIFALRWIAQQMQGEYDQEVIDTIMRHFYVDDMMRSLVSVKMGLIVLAGVQEILGKASFSLAKIGSNNEEILHSVPPEDRAPVYEEISLELEPGVKEHTLGCVFLSKEDLLGFKSVATVVVYTRRGVLSVMSSLFDPLGLVSPFVLKARQILQRICRHGYEWDEQLSDDLKEEWDGWLADLKRVQNYKIPRWLGMSDDEGVKYRMHVFADASEVGYGVVAYLTVTDDEEQMRTCSLVYAKSRVAPMKPVSVPRLELTASVLAVKTEKMLRKFLEVKMEPSVYWSDSMVALHYVTGKPWQFKTFVSNRVVYVQENTTEDQWRHVEGKLNVADLASRGMDGEQMCSSEVWLKGPEFLARRDDWAPTFVSLKQPQIEDDQLELKKKCHYRLQLIEVIGTESEEICRRILTRFSRWNDLIRFVCAWRRITAYFKDKKRWGKSEDYSMEEVCDAERNIIKLIQQIYITKTQKASKMFDKLFPFCEDGLVRVGGRLMMAAMRFEERHPPIFPMCPALYVYLFYVHERIGHGGVDRTYYEARKRYWILGGKVAVKNAISKCLVCKKLRGRFVQQIMAPLPKYRIEEGKAPFERVGVDFCGPFYVKIGRAQVKRYICLITDLVVRAVHTEVVPDMTSSAFVNAFQRFVSRRGKPHLVVSDNGTNFVGAKREMREALAEWNYKKTNRYMTEEGIKWLFNTPTASHHGGVWERLIREFRSLLLALTKDQGLTEDALRTFACLAEQTMNSRPLTKLTEDPQDPLPLTPEHLINLRGAQGIAGDYTKHDALAKRWKHIQLLGDRFWRRWSAEYLRTLQRRVKWTKEKKDLKVGDLVLIMSEQTVRYRWPLGLIVEAMVGRDDHVRSVRMKTERGELVRPVTKVIALECSE